MTQNPKTRKAIERLEVVNAYLSTNMALTVFVELFNGGDVYEKLREETGPIDAEIIDWWVTICMGVLDEEDGLLEKKARSDAMMIESQKKFIGHLKETIAEKDEVYNRSIVMTRAYKAEIASLQKKIERDSCFFESLQRLNTALEGKCAYQQEVIAEQKTRLEALLAEAARK